MGYVGMYRCDPLRSSSSLFWDGVNKSESLALE